MFFIQLSNIISLLFFSFLVFTSFFLPDFSLNFISSHFLSLSDLLVRYLLNEIVFGGNLLLIESSFSVYFVFKFSLFSGKVLSEDSLVFFFLLSFMVFDNSFGHHVHELPLSFFSISHFVSSFLLLGFNKSCVLLIGFDISKSLAFSFFGLLSLVFFIFFKHGS